MSAVEGGPGTVARSVRFSTRIFGLDEIKKAAYRFTDRGVFEFDLIDNEIVCTLRPLDRSHDGDLDLLEDAFRNEVLDQDLRRRIAEETAPIRNAILAYAFSRTGIQGE